ncbi:hypothetical protein Avbf_17864 [Armadillidium vulgare]|nr:hypothetical protein Avbf_17864 [Armadillidium vulgare]
MILRSIFKEVQKFTLFPKSSEYTTITKCLLKVNDSSIREHTEFLKLQCKTVRRNFEVVFDDCLNI